jgi:MinD-like ATPase involved in chromosome partitioning or flagellar assembly
MKNLTMFALGSLTAAQAKEKIKMIIDTDLGLGSDDVGAMNVAHHYANEGLVDILATITSTGYHKSIGAVNVLNTYFGRPEIKLGAYKGIYA